MCVVWLATWKHCQLADSEALWKDSVRGSLELVVLPHAPIVVALLNESEDHPCCDFIRVFQKETAAETIEDDACKQQDTSVSALFPSDSKQQVG